MCQKNALKIEELLKSGQKLKESFGSEVEGYLAEQLKSISTNLEFFKQSTEESILKENKALKGKVDNFTQGH